MDDVYTWILILDEPRRMDEVSDKILSFWLFINLFEWLNCKYNYFDTDIVRIDVNPVSVDAQGGLPHPTLGIS